MKYLVTIVLFYCLDKISAQLHPYINFTTKDGLPTNYVYGVIEDKEGIIWAYTESGISRFDGYEWKNFTTADGLTGSDVISSEYDQYGNIWFDAYQQDVFRLKGEKFVKPKENFEDFYPYLGDLFFTQGKKSYALNENMAVESTFEISTSLIPSIKTYNFQNHKVYYFNSKIIIEQPGKKTELIVKPNFIVDLSRFHSVQLLLIKGKTFFILFGENGCIVYDVATKKSKEIVAKKGSNKSLQKPKIQTYKDHVMVYTGDGLVEIDSELNETDRMYFDFEDNSIAIQNTFKDSKNNLWIGTRNHGLLLIPAKNRSTKILKTAEKLILPIEGLIKDSKHRMICASDDDRIYEVTGNNMKLLHKSNIHSNFKNLTVYSGDTLLYISSSERVLINSDNKFLSFEDKVIKNNHIKEIFSVNPILKIPNFKLLIAVLKTKSALHFVNYSSYIIINKNIKTNRIQQFDALKGRKINFDQKGDNIFFNINEKIYNFSDVTMKEFTPKLEAEINQLKIINLNELLLGLANGTLIHYNLQTNKIRELLTSEIIKYLVVTDDNSFWVAGSESIYHFGKQVSNEFTMINHFSKEQGLSVQDIYCMEVSDSLLYIGSGQGLITFNYLQKQVNESSNGKSSCKLISINGEVISMSEKIKNVNNNLIFIHKIIHYPSNGNIVYFYRLLPIQKQFSKTKDFKTILLNVQPGSYTFEVYGIDIYGKRHDFEPLKFAIVPPFYKTGFFFMLALSTLIIALYFFIKNREKVRNIKMLNEISINKRLNELKLTALQSQMNPHFIFNAVGSIQYFIQTHNTEKADTYLGDFALLIRGILESSKVKYVRLEEDIEMLRLYTNLEMIRFEDLFTTEFIIDKCVDTSYQLPPMIIQPFVENAINHGLYNIKNKKGVLTIHFYCEEGDYLCCRITDNGIGRKASGLLKDPKRHKSRGMQLVQQKLETLKENMDNEIEFKIDDLLEEGEAIGTQVTIKFSKHSE